MRISYRITIFPLIILPLSSFVIEASFFARQPKIIHNSVATRESPSCGPHYIPCGISEPCCNNGTCHSASTSTCPIAHGCNPKYSYANACIPLPGCRNALWEFKDTSLLIPKAEFMGDPEQAPWVSEYSHIAPYAEIDPYEKKLLLRVRRDLVKTQSGGGFGATVSTTRWHKYGTFSVKLRSVSTGPGIVTAILLSSLSGEQISFEVTGKDPRSVVTNYYRKIYKINTASTHSHIDMIPATLSHTITPFSDYSLESHEKIFQLKHDTTEFDLVYKIEWTEEMITWSVGNRILRVVRSSDIDAIGGLLLDDMQLQLTIWDAGHSPETMEWAGGKSTYGPNNLEEYVAAVSAVKINCHMPKNGTWPGRDTLNKLNLQSERMIAGTENEEYDIISSSAKSLFMIFLSIVKWTCLALAFVFGTSTLH